MLNLFYQTHPEIPNSIPEKYRSQSVKHKAGGVADKYLENMLDQVGIPYKCYTPETWNGELAWYIIQIAWIDQATIYNNVFEHIDDKILDLIKNEDCPLKLLISFPTEGFSLKMPRFMDIIDFCIKDKHIPVSQVKFVFGDLNIRNNYNWWCSPNGGKGWAWDLDVYGINSFELNYYHECELMYWKGGGKMALTPAQINKQLISEQEFADSVNVKKPKKYLFRNANPRLHRIYFASVLEQMECIDDGIITFLNRHYTPVVNKGEYSSFRPIDARQTEYYAGKFLARTPITYDHDADTIGEGLNQRFLIKEQYLDTYFSLIMETTFEDAEPENVVFITEKVYQPMINYHPFMIAGNPGLLKQLRDDGFATFPELFDESYDGIPAKSTRAKIILDQTIAWCKNHNYFIEKEQLINSSTIRDKLVHNRNHFINCDKRKKWQDLVDWIMLK